MLGKIEGRRRRGYQRMRLLNGVTSAMDTNLSKLWEVVEGQGGLACCSAWGRRELDTTGGLNSNSRISGGPLLTVLGLSGPFNLASGGFVAVSLWLSTMLPFGTQTRSWSLESCPGMGNKKASVPRTHTRPCSILPSKPL